MKLADLPLHTVPVVEPQTSLAEAVRLMHEEPLGIVIIVGDEQYMGVFTERDLEANLIPPGSDYETLSVGPYATGLRFTGDPQMTLPEALSRMERHRLPVMPVVSGNIYKGVVTREDLMTA